MQEIVDLEDGKCEYKSWEPIAGPGAWVVALMMGGQLDEANRRCGDDLKRMLESKLVETNTSCDGREIPGSTETHGREFSKAF